MPQKDRESNKVIADLIHVHTPDVIKLLEANCGAYRAARAKQSKGNALTFCRKWQHCDSVLIHSGFAELEDKRVEVSFPTPGDATGVEIDSAFLAYLSERMKVGHKVSVTMSGL